MDLFLQGMKQSGLFSSLTDEKILAVLNTMAVRRKTYAKGSFVFYAGDAIAELGLVLRGTVHIVQEDYWGNRNILAQIRPGSVFGEAFACLPGAVATVDVAVVEAAEIMFIDVSRIFQDGLAALPEQQQVLMNLLALLARRNMMLTEKIRYMSQRSTRQKLMFYLSAEAQRHGSPAFTLPFNRQQLADFLSVDRSAMSAELSKMKKDGLLEYHKNSFVLKNEGLPLPKE